MSAWMMPEILGMLVRVMAAGGLAAGLAGEWWS
jgi:hypothetical protein